MSFSVNRHLFLEAPPSSSSLDPLEEETLNSLTEEQGSPASSYKQVPKSGGIIHIDLNKKRNRDRIISVDSSTADTPSLLKRVSAPMPCVQVIEPEQTPKSFQTPPSTDKNGKLSDSISRKSRFNSGSFDELGSPLIKLLPTSGKILYPEDIGVSPCAKKLYPSSMTRIGGDNSPLTPCKLARIKLAPPPPIIGFSEEPIDSFHTTKKGLSFSAEQTPLEKPLVTIAEKAKRPKKTRDMKDKNISIAIGDLSFSEQDSSCNSEDLNDEDASVKDLYSNESSSSCLDTNPDLAGFFQSPPQHYAEYLQVMQSSNVPFKQRRPDGRSSTLWMGADPNILDCIVPKRKASKNF